MLIHRGGKSQNKHIVRVRNAQQIECSAVCGLETSRISHGATGAQWDAGRLGFHPGERRAKISAVQGGTVDGSRVGWCVRGAHWPNRWPSGTFGETLTSFAGQTRGYRVVG